MDKHTAVVFERHLAYVDTGPGGHPTGRTILLLQRRSTVARTRKLRRG